VATGASALAEYKRTTENTVRDELPTKELETQLESKPVLQLQATYGTPKPRQENSYCFYSGFGGGDYVEGTRKEVSVKIVPGPDGKLYVKENDRWRKI
jgi:hypothetical protein